MLQRTSIPQSRFAFEVTSLPLTGAEEITRMQSQDIQVSHWVEEFFRSKESSGYDAEHRLLQLATYRIDVFCGHDFEQPLLTPTIREVLCKEETTTSYLGLMPRICEHFPSELFEEFGIWSVTMLQGSFRNAKGKVHTLNMRFFPGNKNKWLSVEYLPRNRHWSERCAFAQATLVG